ncbi:MAG TPA: peptidase M48, partial [Armatimonadota bacterium]|nr:peptidase M48 [Armatimonadota bacterium]
MNRIRPLVAVVVLLGAVLWHGMPASADILPLDAEISIGREAAQIIEEQYPISTDAILAARVQRIGRRIAGVCGRPDLPFSFKVIDTPDINAFCLPGGFV